MSKILFNDVASATSKYRRKFEFPVRWSWKMARRFTVQVHDAFPGGYAICDSENEEKFVDVVKTEPEALKLANEMNVDLCETGKCEDEECQRCCEHEHDPSEGMMCINCGAEYDW